MFKLNVLPSRREMLWQSCGVALCAGFSGASAMAAASAYAAELMPGMRPRIRLVFTHPRPERQGWPYQHYDYDTRKTDLTGRLRKRCPDTEFLPVTAITKEDAEKILGADDEVDGYILYLFGIPSSAPGVIAYSGRRTILVDDLYGGTGSFLGLYPEALRRELPVTGVSSSRLDELVDAVRAFETIKKLENSVMLDVTERDLDGAIRTYKEALGLTVRPVSSEELNTCYEQADRSEASKWAKTWMDNAEKVVEPSPGEIRKSGAMYVGMRNLLSRHKAQGIAIDCLNLFYGKKMSAYPCLGFFQLNNDGLVGACEADLESASTMLMLTYLLGRPGYISDPVIDTSTNRIIYAHCVAPSKVWGPGGPSNPYQIRDHSEDRKGAAIRSLMPLGEMTTSLKLVPARKTVVMHRARTVANIDEDRACRTKLAAELANPRKMISEWAFGWHRVTVYGDVKVQLENVSRLLGFRVVEEGT